MGLLEDWDRRNQRTADYKRDPANEEVRRRRSPSWRVVLALAVGVALLRHVLSSFLGTGWTLAILAAIGVGCFAVGIVDARRRRRAWEAAHPPAVGAPSSGG